MAKHKKEGGFIDHLLHGDHGKASEHEESEVENDLPVESKPAKQSKKNSVEGASSESKHHHKKNDKFKKGNR